MAVILTYVVTFSTIGMSSTIIKFAGKGPVDRASAPRRNAMSTLPFDVRTRGDLKNDVFPIIAPVPTAGSKATSLKFEIQPATNPTSEKERAARLVDPGFGRIFTDHMAVVRYNQSKGWHDARIESRANFPLDPAAAVLHYAQEIFEGLKAYKRDDGGANLFRPDANARRFWNSAERMAMAPLPEPVFIEAVEQLVRIDRAWIPDGEGSLYLRPFMIASEVFLGVKPSAEYIFAVIASPVGSYFKGGPAPVSIWVSENYTRAAIGGTGAVKCGGNYAASLRAQAEAIDRGCAQVVFLYAVGRRHRAAQEAGRNPVRSRGRPAQLDQKGPVTGGGLFHRFRDRRALLALSISTTCG